MKIEMQISSKYLTYLINNCIKIESRDNKDLKTLCSHTQCWCSLTRSMPVCTARHEHILISQPDLPKSHANISSQTFVFAATLMIEIIPWQLTFHEKKPAKHCLKHQKKKYKGELRSQGEREEGEASQAYCIVHWCQSAQIMFELIVPDLLNGCFL